RRGLDVALDADDLSGEKEPLPSDDLERGEQERRRVDERVPVEAPETHELRAFESRDRAEHAPLRGVRHLGLEPDHVEEPTLRVVLTKLDAGVRPSARARIDEADRAH